MFVVFPFAPLSNPAFDSKQPECILSCISIPKIIQHENNLISTAPESAVLLASRHLKKAQCHCLQKADLLQQNCYTSQLSCPLLCVCVCAHGRQWLRDLAQVNGPFGTA